MSNLALLFSLVHQDLLSQKAPTCKQAPSVLHLGLPALPAPDPDPDTDRLIVAFEYAAYPPLWWSSDDLADREGPAPRFPELTAGLHAELIEWVSFGTRHLILEDGMYDGDRPVEEWCADGLALAIRVEGEVGPKFKVWFVDPVSDERVQITRG